ncbi:MAG TPA: alpha/beta fold hydrolase [Acidimicrobiales bacterium]
MPSLSNGDVSLWYAERGDPAGPPVVLLHGLFFSRRLFERLARRLPGYRLLLLDLRGHGRSSRPVEGDAYAWRAMASDVTALLDELAIERAVVGGLSLGANVTLAFAADHADRLDGALIEMPVLDVGRPQAERTFRPLAAAFDVVGAATAPIARAVRPLRRSRVPEVAAAADLLSLEPVAGAAMLRTLLEDRQPVIDGVDALASAKVPTLVIAHRLDALHPVADAKYIVDRVPNARLVVVSSIVELRLRGGRYADVVVRFLRDLG